jgi:hypothetical protein
VTQRKVTGDKARRSSDLLLAVKRVEKIGTDLLDGLAPSRPFLSPSCRHLADYARQHIGRVLPADEVETLERLVDEIERVSTIGVGPVRLSRKEKLRECSRRGAARMADPAGGFPDNAPDRLCPSFSFALVPFPDLTPPSSVRSHSAQTCRSRRLSGSSFAHFGKPGALTAEIGSQNLGGVEQAGSGA